MLGNRQRAKVNLTLMQKTYRFVSIIILAIVFLVSGNPLVFPPYGHSHGIRKATQGHLFLFLPFSRFDDPQGLATAKMISRDDLSTEKDDDEVVVYGVNSGRHQLIYNTSMWGLATYGKKGSGKNQFMFPKGIACDPQGNVYVVDAGNNRIVHLFNAQKKVKWVKAFSGKKGNDGGLKAPMQVALDAAGKIYVTDTGNRRIIIFDTSGNSLQKISPADSLSFDDGPTTLAVADGSFSWSYFRSERAIFCADRNGKRLWKIDFSGKVLKTVLVPEGYRSFYGAVDYYHNFYITDKEKHCILKFDHNLQLLDIFGSHGKEDNQFIEPRGIAIWKRYGQTFVAEKTGAQYFWVGTGLKQVGFWEKDSTDTFFIKTNVSEYSYMSLFYVTGPDTTALQKNRFLVPGERIFPFTRDGIRSLQGGKYIFRIEPTYSSYTYYHWDYPLQLYNNEKAVPEKLPNGLFVKKKGTRGKKMTIDEMRKEANQNKKKD